MEEMKPDDSISDAKKAAIEAAKTPNPHHRENPPTMRNEDKPPFYETMGWTQAQMDTMSVFLRVCMKKIHENPSTYGKQELLRDLAESQFPESIRLYIAFLIGGFVERDSMAMNIVRNFINSMNEVAMMTANEPQGAPPWSPR